MRKRFTFFQLAKLTKNHYISYLEIESIRYIVKSKEQIRVTNRLFLQNQARFSKEIISADEAAQNTACFAAAAAKHNHEIPFLFGRFCIFVQIKTYFSLIT